MSTASVSRGARGARAVALVLAVGAACSDDVQPSPSGTSDATGSSGTMQASDATTQGDDTSGARDVTDSTGHASASDDETASATDTGTSTSSGASDTSGSDTSSGMDASTGSESGTSSSSSSDGAAESTSSSSSSDGAGVDTEDSGGSSDTGEPMMICVDIDLGGALGLTLGDTAVLADDLDPPCVPGVGGRDAGHRFIAPADGFYTFDTSGSAFDTVLHAYAPDCSGALLGCNDDDTLGVVQARLPLYLGAQEEAVVVVDGWNDTQLGAYSLAVSAAFESCVDEDLGQVLSATIMGTTTGELDKLEPSCLPSSGPDYMVRWVAPSNDVYRIRTSGSSFDTVLYVLPGECAGPAIACNDDATPIDLTSTVLVAPGFGQVVTIVVDGFDPGEHGPFTLSVEPL